MGEPVHPRYKPRNPREVIDNWTSLELLRTSDSASFLGAPIPKIIAKDPTLDPSWETPLISAILPVAGVSMSRILNHPNIISLIDVVQTSETRGYTAKAGKAADFVVFEDMTAGCLAYLLPLAEKLPKWDDIQAWRLLAKQDYNRFSLPESLVWHVAQSIGKALTWLHHGFKETGVPGEWEEHDDDWQPILIRDVSPGQIWFKRPAGAETYGECKLGGFGRCVVTGFPGGLRASGEKPHGAPPAFMQYWAPEVEKDIEPWSREAEIWSLGAVLYTMMTGIPPPRMFDYKWMVSRLGDKDFTPMLQHLVADMLKVNSSERPKGLDVCARAEAGFRAWRETREEAKGFVRLEDMVRVGEI